MANRKEELEIIIVSKLDDVKITTSGLGDKISLSRYAVKICDEIKEYFEGIR